MKSKAAFKRAQFPDILLACLVLLSCGTVHQFIPPQPLEPNEFRGQLTFSYDTNLFALLGSWGASFYIGAGKDINLGFGYQPLAGISHLTAVKYFNPEESSFPRVYLTANDLMFTVDNSPNFEIGAGVTTRKGSAYHTFSAGLWTFIDDRSAQPLWRRMLDFPKIRAGFHPRPRPFLKYDFANSGYALSLENYIGLTKSIILYERWVLEERERIILPGEEIAWLKFDSRSSRIYIKTVDSTEYRVMPYSPYPDKWFPDIDQYRLKRYNLDDSWGYYYVQTIKGNDHSLALYELDFDSIWLGYTAGETIVLGTFPARKREIFKLIKWFKHDWSVGAGMRIGGKTR